MISQLHILCRSFPQSSSLSGSLSIHSLLCALYLCLYELSIPSLSVACIFLSCSWTLLFLSMLVFLSPYLSLSRTCLKPATGRPCVPAFPCKSPQLEDANTHRSTLWITLRFRTISAFLINSECLDASVFTSMLPEIGCKSRTCATRTTDFIFERKHCSWRRRDTLVDLASPR